MRMLWKLKKLIFMYIPILILFRKFLEALWRTLILIDYSLHNDHFKGHKSNLHRFMLLVRRICQWFCNMLCAFFMKRDIKEGLLVFNIIGLALIIFYLFWPFQTDTALKSIQWVLKFKITVLPTVPQRLSHRDCAHRDCPTETITRDCHTETLP